MEDKATVTAGPVALHQPSGPRWDEECRCGMSAVLESTQEKLDLRRFDIQWIRTGCRHHGRERVLQACERDLCT